MRACAASLQGLKTSYCCCLVAQSCPTLCDCQALLSMAFPRQEYWSGLPFLSPGDLPDTLGVNQNQSPTFKQIRSKVFQHRTIFLGRKIFIIFVLFLLLFYLFLAMLHRTGDLSSLPRDWTPAPCTRSIGVPTTEPPGKCKQVDFRASTSSNRYLVLVFFPLPSDFKFRPR